jgi:hypothetical protein
MDQRDCLRHAMLHHLGQVLTPEVAALIERATFSPAPEPIAEDQLLPSTFFPGSVQPLSRKSMREKIDTLEAQMVKHEPLEIRTRHYFSNGLYAREITIPKGTLLTGKIHKTVHLNIISKGRIAVVTEFGEQIIEAPATIVSQPGTKRVGYALEETVWTTLHGTDETDLEKLEAQLIAPSHESLEAPASQGEIPCHG